MTAPRVGMNGAGRTLTGAAPTRYAARAGTGATASTVRPSRIPRWPARPAS